MFSFNDLKYNCYWLLVGGVLNQIFRLFFAIVWFALLSGHAAARVITSDLEVLKIPNVGAIWTTVPLSNSYARTVVVCTYNLPSSAAPTAVTRIRNVTATSFELRIQQFENSSTVTANDVHCIIADEGAHKLPTGLVFEARTVLSDGTSGLSVPNTWGAVNTEEVTTALTQKYLSPVVLGQVMSFNDSKASVFWTNNCVNRNRGPFESVNRICVGKHIGQINGKRNNEVIGYIVAETGTGTVNGMKYQLALGADSVAGVGNSPPYPYALNDDYDIGISSQNAEDGGHGGWSVLYGNDPLPAGRINSAIDEEVFAGDKTRTHTTERVSYWVFKETAKAEVKAKKSVHISAESSSPYSIPGADFVYTIAAANTGYVPLDNNSVFISDQLPPETIFYNADIDGPGPETGVTIFSDSGSGLTYNEATDLRFSNLATSPANFASCSYSPAAGYDVNVRHICLNPKGIFSAGALAPSSFQVSFRVQLK